MTEERKQRYLTKFDEIELITAETLIELENETIEERIKRITDDVEDVLIEMYLFGFKEANEMLGIENEVDTDKMYESIYKKIDDKDFRDRISNYVIDGTIAEIARVIDTDSHRVVNDGLIDNAMDSELPIKKTWVTMEDLKVRDTHFYLDGVTIPLNEKFTTYTGASALSPGEFGTAEEDCNCRCWLDLTVE